MHDMAGQDLQPGDYVVHEGPQVYFEDNNNATYLVSEVLKVHKDRVVVDFAWTDEDHIHKGKVSPASPRRGLKANKQMFDDFNNSPLWLHESDMDNRYDKRSCVFVRPSSLK